MSRLGIGMVGAGHIARFHAEVWRREARLVAICSRQYHKAAALAREFEIPRVCRDLDELVGCDDVDVVCITTPHHLHHPFALRAIDAGKHVFCEKPLAMNSAQAKEMLERARDAGVKTGIQFSERTTWPSLIHLASMIRRGDLGAIRYFEGAWAFDWARSPDHPYSWRFEKEAAGTGVLGDLGSYMIDAARWLVGEISQVRATLVTHVSRRPVAPALLDFGQLRRRFEDGTLPAPLEYGDVENDDACVLYLRFQNGASGYIKASRMERYNDIRVKGTEASCIWHLSDQRLRFRSTGKPEYEMVPIPGSVASRSMVAQFLENVRDDTEIPPTFQDGMMAQQVIDAAVVSSDSGKWISLQ